MKPYRGRRGAADRVASHAIVGAVLLAVFMLISSGKTDIDGKIYPVDKPVAPPMATPSEKLPEPTPEPLVSSAPPVGTAAEPVETLTYIGVHQIYGYNYTDAKQCGKTVADGVTASGDKAVSGKTCAMSKDVPFGTVVYIDGIGYFTVNDRGVGPGIVDIAFDNNADCYAVTGKYDVYIVEGW